MLNGKYVPLDQIIEKVYRDTGLKGNEIDIIECAEWAGEALHLIAAPTSLINMVASIPIKDGRGVLPCDLKYIVQVREFDTKSPMRASTNTFHRFFKRDSSSNSNSPTIGEGLYANEAYQDVKGIFNEDVSDSDFNKSYRDLTYEINDNYIFPNFKEGDIEMAYKAFPVSETGLPKIPDDIAFKKAVEYYIRHQINHRMWRIGSIQDKVYQKEEQDKDWYIGKAQNKARLPSYDEMESLKNDHIRLTPQIHNWSDFFETMGAPHNDDHNSGFGGYYYGGSYPRY